MIIPKDATPTRGDNEDEAPAPASKRFESAYADSPESPPPPPARVENPYDKPAGGGAGASPVAKNPFE